MSPAPSRIHQELIMEISAEIRNYIKANKGQCKVYPAPFDVVLINDNENEKDSRNNSEDLRQTVRNIEF